MSRPLPAIEVGGVGKRYRLGELPNYCPTLRESIEGGARRLLRQLTSRPAERRSRPATFWALKDVSFSVSHGEVVGIIGKNGSGKSTLLKILSRITRPTTGEYVLRGRLASLLEVGTGFHPELTGAENIALNGALLGMSRGELNKKFEEIVEYAELKRFIDTPVKRYSSGMYVRLAFAVAAHLEPEILLIDEVLAVGDADFQKKCLGKMEEAARQGRTILFASHNLGSIQTLCTRAILLRNGEIAADGPAAETVGAYLRALEKVEGQRVRERTDRSGAGAVRLTDVRISAGADCLESTLATGRPARFVFESEGVSAGVSCSFTVYDRLGQAVTYFDSALTSDNDSISRGASVFTCEIEQLLLIPGRYRINVGLSRHGEIEDHLEAAAAFDVEQGEIGGRAIPSDAGYGSVIMPHRWKRPPSRLAASGAPVRAAVRRS